MALQPGTTQIHSMQVSDYMSRMTSHRMLVTWGAQGAIDYRVKDAATGEILIRYVVEGVNVRAVGYIKQGLYREAAYCPATAYVGDFDFSLRKEAGAE